MNVLRNSQRIVDGTDGTDGWAMLFFNDATSLEPETKKRFNPNARNQNNQGNTTHYLITINTKHSYYLLFVFTHTKGYNLSIKTRAPCLLKTDGKTKHSSIVFKINIRESVIDCLLIVQGSAQ